MSSGLGATARPAGRIEQRLARRGGAIELLRVPAALFGVAAGARSALYELGLLQSVRLDVPVISVGNLTAGGTGKTPMVAWLARELERRGRRVGILSRGYGAKVDGANDEALLLAELAPGVEHVRDVDRVRGARELARRGIDVIVLDDGFQHRRLARDLDLVLIDATRPWGLEASDGKPPVRALLPRGLLRETPRNLARADLVILTRVDQVASRELESLRVELTSLAPGRPLATAVHRAARVRDPENRAQPIESVKDVEFELASGIGNPDAFERTVRALGARVVAHHRFPDHHAWSASELGLFAPPRRVLTTAKDAVKLRALGAKPWVLEIELEVRDGAQVLEALLDALRESKAELERRNLHEGAHG